MYRLKNKGEIITIFLSLKKINIMGIFGNMFGGENKKEGKFAQLIEAWKTDLNLTQEQVQQIREAAKSFREQRQELKSEGSDRSKIVEARKNTMEKIATFLDDKQRQILKDNAAKYDSILHGNK